MSPFDVRMIIQDVLQYVLILVGLLSGARLLRAYLARRGASPKELRDVAERLARLEQAVDTVAVEVERVAEAQRFAARLLAEQRKPPSLEPHSPGHAAAAE